MGNVFLFNGSALKVNAGSLRLVLNQPSNLTGTLTGTFQFTGAARTSADRYDRNSSSPAARSRDSDQTISGQIVGTFLQTLDPKDSPRPSPSGAGTTLPSASTPASVESGAPNPASPLAARSRANNDTTGFCPSGCNARIGDFKLVARYQYPHPTWGTLKCEEKAFQLPSNWPGGPYLHSVVCKGPNANGVPITLVNFRLAATERVKDQDIVIVFDNATGQGSFRGTNRQYWRVKIYGTDDVESMTIEMARK
jgi:hypothetical protein